MKVRLTSAGWRRRKGKGFEYFFRGDVFEVSEKHGAHLLKSKSAVDVDAVPEEAPAADPADDVVAEAFAAADAAITDDTPPGDAPERPKNAANKDTWVAYYASVRGKAPAASMTKEEIMAEVG